MSGDFLHKLFVLLACEQINLHDTPSNYLNSYPEWTERTEALKIIIWGYKTRIYNHLIIDNLKSKCEVEYE